MTRLMQSDNLKPANVNRILRESKEYIYLFVYFDIMIKLSTELNINLCCDFTLLA